MLIDSLHSATLLGADFLQCQTYVAIYEIHSRFVEIYFLFFYFYNIEYSRDKLDKVIDYFLRYEKKEEGKFMQSVALPPFRA